MDPQYEIEWKDKHSTSLIVSNEPLEINPWPKSWVF